MKINVAAYSKLESIIYNVELTFAGRSTLRPLVMSAFIAGTTTVLKPSTTRGATTVSTGFLEPTALWTRQCAGRGDG